VSGQFRAPALFTRQKYVLELNKKLGGASKGVLDAREKRKISCPCRDSNSGSFNPQPDSKKRYGYLVRNVCGPCSWADDDSLLGKTVMAVGALAELRLVAVNFVTSVRPRRTTRLPLDGYS